MKKLILLITFTFCCLNMFAQQEPTPTPSTDRSTGGRGTPVNSGDFKISLDGSAPAVSNRTISKGQTISGGVLNGKAISLPKPSYPAAAKAVRASGQVNVQVTIDEEGNVISASVPSGHPLLRQSAEQAARSSKFAPTVLSGQPVKITGVIIYNFVLDITDWLAIGKHLADHSEFNLNDVMKSLPQDFVSEKLSIGKMIEEKSTTGIDDLTNLIESRLQINKVNLWEFQIGTSLGRILFDQENSNTLRTNLLKIRQLSDFPPSEIEAYRLEPIKALAIFSNLQELTDKDKAKIIELCNSIR